MLLRAFMNRVWTAGDVAAVDEYLASTYLRFELGEFVAEGNRVALSWTMQGTNTDSMGGRAPSGRTIAVHGLTIYYFADGKITGNRQGVDRLSVVQQLGLVGK